MAAAFSGLHSRIASLPLRLLLAVFLCLPLAANALDARSESASISLTGKGVAAAVESRLADAQRYLEEAMVANPANVRAITELGVVHQARGNMKLARKYYLIALSVDPVEPDALNRLGHLDILSGDRVAAEESLARLKISCPACRQTGDLAGALEAAPPAKSEISPSNP